MDKVIRDGLVAMQHRTSNPRTVKIDGDGTLYSFVPQHNVSLAMVKPEHVDVLLRHQSKVCCGKKGQTFYLASLINYNLWRYGNRHGQEGEQ